MTLNEWVFILSGIVGVLVLSVMGSLHWRGTRTGWSERSGRSDETDAPARELRVFLRPEGVDLLINRLEAAGAKQISITQTHAIRHIGAWEAGTDGEWARVDLSCNADEVPLFTGVMQDANGTQGLGIEHIYLSTVARIIDPEVDSTVQT